jgi:hypothetical protein
MNFLMLESEKIGMTSQEKELLISHQFMEIKTTIADLTQVTKDGFSSLEKEFRLGREQGHIPVNVMEKLLTSNNEAYMAMITAINTSNTESRKSSNETNTQLLNRVLTMMCVLLAWVTGMKFFLPDNSAQDITNALKQIIRIENPADTTGQINTKSAK